MAGGTAQRTRRARLETRALGFQLNDGVFQIANGLNVGQLLFFLFIDLAQLGQFGGDFLQLLLALQLSIHQLLSAGVERDKARMKGTELLALRARRHVFGDPGGDLFLGER